jgi:type VI protein secretion system component Hcp
MKHILLFLFVTGCLFVHKANGQTTENIYLRMDGINGSSTVATPDNRKLVEVAALSNGISSPVIVTTPTSPPHPNQQSLTFMLKSFADAQAFKAMFYTGKPSAKAYFIYTTLNKPISPQTDFYIIALSNAVITEFSEAGSSGDNPFVTISLAFEAEVFYTRTYPASGPIKIGVAGWDFVTEKTTTSPPLPYNY